MRVQNVTTEAPKPVNQPQPNVGALSKKRNNVAFKATPKQILDVLDTARICPGKKGLVGSVAEFFYFAEREMAKIKDAPKEFIYKLGQKNDVPKPLEHLAVEGTTIAKLDEVLNDNPFKCSPTSKCGCGGGMSKGEFAAKLIESMGVDEPNVIKISKP